MTALYSGAPNSAQSTAPSTSASVVITITGIAPASTSLLVLPSIAQQGTYNITATLLAASSTTGHGTLTVDQSVPNFSMSLGTQRGQTFRRSFSRHKACLRTTSPAPVLLAI